MSINIRLSLPPNVSVRNVAAVIGVLLGARARKTDLGEGAYVADVAGVEVRSSAAGMPECADINVIPPGAGHYRRFLYHFELPDGRRLLMPTSTAENVALAKALVDFFGGRLSYADHDETPDYVVPDKGDEENHPTDGEPWHRLQDRILALSPLTKKDVSACRAFAAY